jgi:hypothetical protein
MSYLGPTFGNLGNRTGVQQGITSQSQNLGRQAGQAAGQRSSEYGALMPGFSSLLNSGYSDAEKSAINQSTLGAINANYGAANDAAARRMARTNNSAGFGSFLKSSSMNRWKDLASQNLQNQKDFADESLRRKMLGLQGIAGLYGIDTSFLNSLNADQNQLVSNATNLYGITKGHPGFLDSLSQSLGSGLGQAIAGLI